MTFPLKVGFSKQKPATFVDEQIFKSHLSDPENPSESDKEVTGSSSLELAQTERTVTSTPIRIRPDSVHPLDSVQRPALTSHVPHICESTYNTRPPFPHSPSAFVCFGLTNQSS